MAQENILIVAEDLDDVAPADGLVDDPDDADEDGAMLNFDFTALGTVTIEAITLIDIEDDGVESAEVTLYDAAGVQIGVPFPLPNTGDNGLAIDIPLGPTPGVRFMDVALNGSGGIDNIVCTPNAGCTPGYWKQQQHFDSWTAPYDYFDLFTSAGFENAYPGKNLLGVLKNGGNRYGLEALGRHTVAALLNAASPDVEYGMTVGEVIAAFNAVFPGSKSAYIDLKNTFAGLNESGCPLN